ncbi:MAG: hypothetical protein IPJ73_22020 [Zoogloea sp.]|nr:hypothetical protein [Zoogloea sp.]
MAPSIDEALPRVIDTRLVEFGLRERIRVIAAGKLADFGTGRVWPLGGGADF